MTTSKVDGYVYLIASSNKLHKIGCTRQPAKRLAHLRQHHKAHRLELLHLIPCSNMHLAELVLHDRFAVQRIAGEWFDLDERGVALVMRIKHMRNYPAPDYKATAVSVRLLDGRACVPDQWAGMVEESEELPGFRLTCTSCRQPAQLTVTRDFDNYDPQFASLDVELNCSRCSKVATTGLRSLFDGWGTDDEAYPYQGRLFANIQRYACTDLIVDNDHLPY